jgi:hypothetical protein
MRNPLTCSRGLLLAMLLGLTGCASRQPVPIECPSYVPSPEALKPMEGTGWKPLAGRVIETYSRPSSAP